LHYGATKYNTVKAITRNVNLSDCQDVYERGYRVSSVYEVQPEGAPHADGVYCQLVNDTAWTVVQRRVDGSVSFQRGWNDYRHGFGGAYGEHWVGTDRLHWLTTQRPCRLRVDLWDWDVYGTSALTVERTSSATWRERETGHRHRPRFSVLGQRIAVEWAQFAAVERRRTPSSGTSALIAVV